MTTPSNMASSNSHSPDPTTPQSIPLQDLTRPPDSEDTTDHHRSRRRSSSGVGRAIGHRRSLIGRSFNRNYERIAETSPSPADLRSLNPQRPAPLSTQHGPSPYNEDGGSASPLEDLGGFHAAISSVGLSFGSPSIPPQSTSPYPIISGGPEGSPMDEEDSSPETRRNAMSSDSDFFSPMETDTTPLTDSRHIQPISGAPASTRTQRPNRQSVHFVDGPAPSSHLGDDLPNLESGLRPERSGSTLGRRRSSSRSRSRSPSSSNSPLSRAGSIMRMMSQRVVNLSNDPETVDQSIRRKSSLRHARMDTPPSLPAMQEYAHDEPHEAGATNGFESKPPEKGEPVMLSVQAKRWRAELNPLRGNSLGIFSPENKLRRQLLEFLVHPAIEPVILILIVVQTVLLAVDAAPSVYTDPRSKRWGTSKIDYAMFALYVIYSVEVVVRIIVSGLILNPVEYSTINRGEGLKNALLEKSRTFLGPVRQPSQKRPPEDHPQQSILRSFTGLQGPAEQPGHGRQQQRMRLARRAFLRHSFNRLDFAAVVSYWISFALGLQGVESQKHIYVFQMLSCLRILRLLGLTSGTSIILRSLKKAAPLLVNVAFLIGFFWLLFAIIGVQSFKSSLRRTCVWVDPTGRQDNFTLNDPNGSLQFCGGYINATTGESWPWRFPDGRNGTDGTKGYLCPVNSICVQGDNPYGGTISFDNIGQSLEMVFVVMSSNTFSDIMYYTADSDYLTSALFFAAAIVFMSFWLVNLLIAVITSSFQVIREESKTSAFTAEAVDEEPLEDVEPSRVNRLKKIYDKTYWLWVLVILLDLIVQCLRSASMSSSRRHSIDNTETVVTLVLVIEIILRFATDWRHFHQSKRNWVDLGLAVITAAIQIPAIPKSSQAYAWLTIFQILRIYRCVTAFSITRDLIMTVFGNIYGLLNLIVFVFLVTFLAAIFASQLFRGEFPPEINGNELHVTFFDIYNSFLGMYQILSSENWTSIMYNATLLERGWNTSWIAAAFFILWFIFANFIVVNMFIAVIQESFDVSEDEKRMQQVKAFLQQKEMGGSSQSTLSLSTIFKFGRDSVRRKDPLDYGQASLEMLLKETVVKEFLDEEDQPIDRQATLNRMQTDQAATQVETGVLSSLWGKITGLNPKHEPNPFYSKIKFSRAYEDLDPRTMAKEVVSANEQRKRAQRQYLARHPGYNVSLFIFKPTNPIRRFCQKIVGPGRGSQRIQGVDPVKGVWFAFSAFIYAAIVAMVLLACVTTPLYQREYFMTHEFSVRNWFVWCDMGFAILFTVEAIIKVIADGFFFTPNAYFRGSWGFIDGLVLITLYINVITSLYKDGSISRAVGAFKALRALRLLNVSDSARDTFHSVIILHGWKVVSAAFVSLSLLFPFAIYGLNLFHGQMRSCNDGDFPRADLANCVGEYTNTPFEWPVLSPRIVSNPYYSFDNFGSSFFILFQIVSQEGWTDVMWSAMSITGRTTQPEAFASQGNALFFVAFNLLGAVFVLTLFVSVFMRNYTEQTGVAFLTADQRAWLELRKLLRQINPSKRSTKKNDSQWRSWCYRMAVMKHGKWQRFVTTVLMCHLLVLVLEFYPEVYWWDRTREFLFLGFTILFVSNVFIRIIGLGWKRFRRSSWDLYSIFAVSGTSVTTVMAVAGYDDRTFTRINKLFLVSIPLMLIPRNNQLDQLFKTAAASLTAIANLLATWFILFLVYAIAFTQTFGLTRFGANETDNLNFRTVPKALILLFRTSIGEGWNEIMEDFATISSPYCTSQDDFFQSDCGSAAWARVLFISWNLFSMYIFVSLFVSLIFESFSYVYQRSSGLSVISREEIRRFKQAWATFDPDGTGYISKEQFPRLLGELSGVFEMRIYDGENTVGSILEDCRVNPRLSDTNPRIVEGVDLDKLNRRLSRIPVQKIRERRQRMQIFYEEILVSADADRGISFTSCLMIIAHYNVISDSKSLRLEEFLRRRARLQRVEEAVRRSIVIGFFDTMYWSRAFRRKMQGIRASRMAQIPHFTVPEIFVDDQDNVDYSGRRSPLLSPHSIDVTSPSAMPKNPSPRNSGSSTSSFSARNVPPIDTSVSRRSGTGSIQDPAVPRDISPQLSPHRLSHMSNFSTDTGYYGALGRSSPTSPRSPGGGRTSPITGGSRRGSAQEESSGVDTQGIMDSLDHSAWGESIRRSFTMRRSRHGR